MAKFLIGKDDEFQAGRLNAFDQLKVLKRLVGPFSKVMSSDLLKALVAGEGKTDVDLDGLFKTFAEAASTINDEDLEFLIMKCCAACERRASGAWAPIIVPNSNGLFAFPDLQQDAGKLLRITFEVVRENLAGFFDALPSTLGLGEKTAPAA